MKLKQYLVDQFNRQEIQVKITPNNSRDIETLRTILPTASGQICAYYKKIYVGYACNEAPYPDLPIVHIEDFIDNSKTVREWFEAVEHPRLRAWLLENMCSPDKLCDSEIRALYGGITWYKTDFCYACELSYKAKSWQPLIEAIEAKYGKDYGVEPGPIFTTQKPIDKPVEIELADTRKVIGWRLNVDVPEQGLKAGDVSTDVDEHGYAYFNDEILQPSVLPYIATPTYGHEFTTEAGKTVALTEVDIEKIVNLKK